MLRQNQKNTAMRMISWVALCVVGPLCLSIQQAEAGYPDGMNQYAAYHVMHQDVDPTGLISGNFELARGGGGGAGGRNIGQNGWGGGPNELVRHRNFHGRSSMFYEAPRPAIARSASPPPVVPIRQSGTSISPQTFPTDPRSIGRPNSASGGIFTFDNLTLHDNRASTKMAENLVSHDLYDLIYNTTGDPAAAARECALARGQWECLAKCQIVHIESNTVVEYGVGSGTGGSKYMACDNAKSNVIVPRGHYKRHCKCTCVK